MTRIPRISVAGTGSVARAIGAAQRAAGGEIAAVASRDAARAQTVAAECGARVATTDVAALLAADVVIVCVADRAIGEVGARLASAARAAAAPAVPVLHTSGALAGAALLAAAAAPGGPGAGAPFAAGSLHPLQSFPAGLAGAAGLRELASRVPGTHWFHEGAASAAAESLVRAWGGTFHALAPGGKALYHAGAAVVSNHAVALFADATRLLAAAGVPPEESRAALATLLEGTAANLRAVGVPQALTGPVARGDVATVRRHVEALGAFAPDVLEAYRAMALRAVAVAVEKGTLDRAAERALRAVLAAAAPPS